MTPPAEPRAQWPSEQHHEQARGVGAGVGVGNAARDDASLPAPPGLNHPHAPPPPRPAGLHGRALGLVLIFATAGIWVASSFVSELLVSAKARDRDDPAAAARHVPPLVLTYLATSLFSLFLPFVRARRWWRRRQRAARGAGGLGAGVAYAPLMAGGGTRSDGPSAAAAAAATAGGAFDNDDDDGGGGGGGLRFEPDEEFGGHSQARAGGPGARGTGGLPSGNNNNHNNNNNTINNNNSSGDNSSGDNSGAEDALEAVADAEAWRAALRCFALWFCAQWLFNVSLSLTSVTVNTVLSSASSVFTFALSMAALREPYSRAKALALAACVAGTAVVTLSDARSEEAGGDGALGTGGAGGGGGGGPVGPPPSSPFPDDGGGLLAAGTTARGASAASLWGGLAGGAGAGGAGALAGLAGDVACLVSAMFYACYTVTLRAALPNDDEADLEAFFGYVGALCFCAASPLVLAAVLLGRWLPWRTTAAAYGLILLEGILDYALSDYLWARAVLLLGPTLATMGLSAQIPVAAAAELLAGRAPWARSRGSLAATLAGTALILAGFFGGNAAAAGDPVPGGHHRQQQQQQQQQQGGGGGGGGEGGGGGGGGEGGGDGSGPSTPRRQRRREEWAAVAAAGSPPGLGRAGSLGRGASSSMDGGEGGGGGGAAAAGGAGPALSVADGAPPPPLPLPPLPPPASFAPSKVDVYAGVAGAGHQEVELQAVSGGGGGDGFRVGVADGGGGGGGGGGAAALHRLARETR